MTTVLTADRARLTLGPEVARGGEGVVWRVRERPGMVAKLYQPKVPARAAEKLGAMLARRPADPTAARLGHTSIAWPLEAVYDERRRFAGFLMPGIFDGRPLVDVYNRKRRTQVLPGFDRRYLHRTAANLAAALGALHAHGLVVGDLNESNVLVRPNALVTLIDTDSYQVPNRRGREPLIFPCPVGKFEYSPPELQGTTFAGTVRTPEHDRFALGVLIFQLLMEGSHPFRARWLGEGEPPSTDQKISQGLFPHAKPAPKVLEPPPGLPSLDVLHPDLAALVRRCFVEGHRDPTKRPLPAEWERALSVAERALVRCPNGHYYGGHLRSCSWCGSTRGRKPAALPEAAPDGREAPRRTATQASPAAPPPSPFPPRSTQTGRHAWRDAMMVTIASLLILALVATDMFSPLSAILIPDPRPTARSGQERSAVGGTTEQPADGPTQPRDFEVGQLVRVSTTTRFPVYEEPDWNSDRVGMVDPGAVVRIAGQWRQDDNGIWWPIEDPATGLEGYIWQDHLAGPLARG